MSELSLAYKIPLMVVALLIAIIGHEIMHGYVAYRYGDSTAKDSGRLSLNPIIHIDLIGSILVPATLFLANAPFLFGWAKPVPVRMDRVIYNGGYFAAFLVSLAGIGYNLVLAILASLLLYGFNGGILSGVFGYFENPQFLFILVIFFFLQLIIYNVILAIFNLLPIPPLDGSNALAYLGLMFKNDFFARAFNKIHPVVGMVVLILILSTPLSIILSAPVDFVLQWLLS